MIDYESLSKLVEDFLKIFGIEPKENILACITIGIYVVIGVFILVIIFFIKNNRWRKKQRDEILKGYEKYTTLRQRWLYIKTNIQEKPPHDLPEPYDSQSRYFRATPIDFFLKKVFKKGNQNPPYYCILGGSGMGKSTFVVNLVWKYINKYREKTLPYPIKLIYCGEIIEGNDSLLKRINDIEKKENTILILDALDENNEAIDNYSDFFTQLWEKVTRFRIVVITCRTQFFEKIEDEPNLLPSRDPATKKQMQFEKYYISPFQDDEIDRYLNKKYLLRFLAKRKAKSIVNNCKQLMARPMLLSYLDDLLGSPIGNEQESIVQIYDNLIDKWLDRETYFLATTEKDKKEKKQNLHEFSNELALCLAQPTYDKKQIDDIIARYGANTLIKERNLKGRSLLNRNSRNEFKFAHKSFMEFLVAKQLLDSYKRIPLESIDFISNDMISKFISSSLFGDQFVDLYFNSYFSYEIKLEKKERHILFLSIFLSCNISDNILKLVSDFVSAKYPTNSIKVAVNFDIDCYYDCSKIFDDNTLFLYMDKVGILNVLTISNYNFMDINVVEFIERVLFLFNEVIIKVDNVYPFYDANPQVLERLKSLVNHSGKELTFRKYSGQNIRIRDHL